MFYVRVFIALLWFLVICIYMCVLSVFRKGDAELNRDFGQNLAFVIFPLFGIRVVVEGQENIPRNTPVVGVANHQSGIDILTFTTCSPPNSIAIAKKELLWIPFFGFFYLMAGNLLIDRANRSKAYMIIDLAVERIVKRRVSLWMFAEGTRNRSGEGMLPFKKGAFKAAIQAQVPVVPYVSSPLKGVIHWKGKSAKGGLITIRILPAIPTQGMKEDDVGALMARTRDEMMKAYIDLAERQKSGLQQGS